MPNESPEGEATPVIDPALLAAVRQVMAEMQRPTVIASESGVNSVKLNALASGLTQVEVKIYHEDPDVAAAIARRIYTAEIEHWSGRKPPAKP